MKIDNLQRILAKCIGHLAVEHECMQEGHRLQSGHAQRCPRREIAKPKSKTHHDATTRFKQWLLPMMAHSLFGWL